MRGNEVLKVTDARTALASMVAPETRVAALAMAARAKVAIEKRILTVRGRL